MKDKIIIDGKEIELSKETVDNIKKQLLQKESFIEKDVSVCSYKFISDIDWSKKENIKNTKRIDFRIYINNKFADHSVFGNNCIFIKCKFGSDCEFGSSCKFGSSCTFGSGCEFGSYCEFGFDCTFGSSCKFGSYCEFGSYCKFESYCEFETSCKKQKPYWDEDGRHD